MSPHIAGVYMKFKVMIGDQSLSHTTVLETIILVNIIVATADSYKNSIDLGIFTA